MRKKRIEEKENIIFKNNIVKITKENDEQLCFEIVNYITYDISEAVSLLIKYDLSDKIWDIDIKVNINDILPEKTLYWLSGGEKEWTTKEHYIKDWSDCYLDFQEQFGFIIMNILRKSRKLRDIKKGFNKNLNLPIIYDFAISKNLVK
jgi:hypothetical protein